VQAYPGKNSVWIMDGAKIHLLDSMTSYFRSVGIVLIFLPAYCPQINPIEYVFGQVKAQIQYFYEDGVVDFKDLSVFVLTTMLLFKNKTMIPLMGHCGYENVSQFNPRQLIEKLNRESDIFNL
jgi:transposase